MANIASIDVFTSARAMDSDSIRNKTVVVIDVMYTTTAIVQALHNGARNVIPAADLGEAGRISLTTASENMLLCGEKDGNPIEGFDLGVYPADFTRERVEGKSLIMNTTNGTKAISKSIPAKKLMIASFLNLSSVVEALRETEDEIALLSAGWNGRISLEDLLLAGNMIEKLHAGEPKSELSDGVVVALGVYQSYKDTIEEIISNSNNAARMKKLLGEQFESKWYTQIDICSRIPVLKDGMITFEDDKKPIE